jgi:hypothetical protein
VARFIEWCLENKALAIYIAAGVIIVLMAGPDADGVRAGFDLRGSFPDY